MGELHLLPSECVFIHDNVITKFGVFNIYIFYVSDKKSMTKLFALNFEIRALIQ